MKETITLERTYPVSLEQVWALWTTKDGLQSWWGPEGFSVKVHELDLRPGGVWKYAMTATAPQQIEFMKKAGMPLTTEQQVTYTEVTPLKRFAYDSMVDFVPGVAKYTAAAWVEFHPGAQSVRTVVTLDAMHDARWTEMARTGWESQLGKLTKVLHA